MDSDYISSEEMGTLWLTALDLSSELELDQLLAMVVRSSRSLLAADAGEIYLLKEGGQLRRVGEDPAAPSILPNTLQMSEGFVGKVVKTGKALVIDNLDVLHGRSLVRNSRPIGSIICVPLVTNGETLGVLSLSSFDDEKHFGARQAELLTMFASSAAIAIANALEIMHLKKAIEDLAKKTLQLLQPERKSAVEVTSISPREDVKANGAVIPGERSTRDASSMEEKLAAFHRLQGMLKTKAPPPTDEELKQEYIDYLAEKYS